MVFFRYSTTAVFFRDSNTAGLVQICYYRWSFSDILYSITGGLFQTFYYRRSFFRDSVSEDTKVGEMDKAGR